MKNVAAIFFSAILFFLITNNSANSSTEIKKINDQLESVEKLFESKVIDEATYNSSKKKLIDRKKIIEAKVTNQNSDTQSKTLDKQIEVLEKLYKDGVISEEEFKKTTNFLKEKETSGENIDLNEISQNASASYKLNIQKDIPGKKKWAWEPAELIYKNYKIETYRPGGIRVIRTSDGKKLLQITANYKIRYFNDGESVIKIEKKVYQVDRAATPDELIKNVEKSVSKSFSDLGELLSNPVDKLFNKNKKKPVFDKESHKLELFIEGKKILQYEGRYVKKHKAFFYQVLTPKYEPFHYYIKISGKNEIALHMGLFNAKIDKAVRKAKTRLAAEYNISEAEIERIIEKKIEQETEKSIEKEMEKAIEKSVEEAIRQTVGEVMSAQLISAIEEATGEAIDASIEQELAAAIDAEIAYAVSIGIDEAAVTAGWEAYFEVLAQGGSVEQASEAAYKACGAACDNY
tara:strand:+ start:1075 stop:2457 length:1383 start_codon:yes stop_codon:yes gene_type:complete